jgi:hypothetical protein
MKTQVVAAIRAQLRHFQGVVLIYLPLASTATHSKTQKFESGGPGPSAENDNEHEEAPASGDEDDSDHDFLLASGTLPDSITKACAVLSLKQRLARLRKGFHEIEKMMVFSDTTPSHCLR